MLSESCYILVMNNKIFKEEIIWFLEEASLDTDERRLSMSLYILNQIGICKNIHYTIFMYSGMCFKLP